MNFDIDPSDFGPGSFDSLRPNCCECGSAEHVDLAQAEIIYPNRPDLWQRANGSRPWYWLCSACWAYCGTHAGTLKPLGRPAGEPTRRMRSEAHAAFDPLWQKRQRLSGLSKHHARGKGYKWLAVELGIDRKDCHIAMMDFKTAKRVVDICRAVRK